MQKTEENLKRRHQRVSWFLRRQIAIQYHEGTKTLKELSEEYNIPHQSISRWSREYASDLQKRKGRIFNNMTNEEMKRYQELVEENERLKKQVESLTPDHVLQQENEVLRKDLEFARMKTKAMETIIDLAKEEYGLDLRKNSGARQPVRSKQTIRRQK